MEILRSSGLIQGIFAVIAALGAGACSPAAAPEPPPSAAPPATSAPAPVAASAPALAPAAASAAPPATASAPAPTASARWAPGSRDEKLAALCNLQPTADGKGVGCGCCPPFEARACSAWKKGDDLFEVGAWLPGSFSDKGKHEALLFLKSCPAPVTWLSGAAALLDDGPQLKLRWRSNDGSNQAYRAALSADGQPGAMASAGTVIAPKSWLTGWTIYLSTYLGAPAREPAVKVLLEMPSSAFAECSADSPRKSKVFVGWVRSLTADKNTLKATVAYAAGNAGKPIEAACEQLQNQDTNAVATWEAMGKAVGKVQPEELTWTWDGASATPSKETKAALDRIASVRRGAYAPK